MGLPGRTAAPMDPSGTTPTVIRHHYTSPTRRVGASFVASERYRILQRMERNSSLQRWRGFQEMWVSCMKHAPVGKVKAGFMHGERSDFLLLDLGRWSSLTC